MRVRLKDPCYFTANLSFLGINIIRLGRYAEYLGAAEAISSDFTLDGARLPGFCLFNQYSRPRTWDSPDRGNTTLSR